VADFLLEIGTEEIPAGMVWDLAVNLGHNVSEALEKEGMTSAADGPPREPMFAFIPGNPAWRLMPGMTLLAAPRRIGFLLEGLPLRQSDREETVAGPPLSAARDASGAWTRAAEGFARKQGVAMGDLKEVAGLKGPCVGFVRHVPGRSAAEVLAEVVPRAVDALYLPKAMRWGEGTEVFVRPVRWVVALLDDQVVRLTIKGIEAGRTSRGHRIHGTDRVEVPSAKAYFDVMRNQHVLSDPVERKNKIRKELDELAAAVGGVWSVHRDNPSESVLFGGLLETLVFTCEHPTAFRGSIPEAFLSLPEPVLSTCLKEHQKSFAVYATSDPNDPLAGVPQTEEGLALRPFFLAVLDGPSDPTGLVRRGNENVTVSRLKDAKFFYDQDKKVPLAERLNDLKGIVYHPKLGTYYDKALRMEVLARELAPTFQEDPDLAGRAALLCKGDLASLLVQEKEFTSLQGVAGGLYAQAQGEDPAVARAIGEHYGEPLPQPGSAHPHLSVVVALADKLDTLVQFFSIGLAPTGSKDPFGLRRAANQVVSMLGDPGLFAGGHSGLRFDLSAFLRSHAPDCAASLEDFILERARYSWEGKGVAEAKGAPSYDELNAVLSQGLSDLLDMRARLEAVHTVRRQYPEDFDHLAVAFKRAKNILKGMPEVDLDPSLFLPPEEKEGAGERALHEAVEAVRQEAEELFEQRRYAEGLQRLATVRPAVDRFFDDVLVMCDPDGKDPARTALQNNRLALLRGLVALFDRVADFSQIVPRENR